MDKRLILAVAGSGKTRSIVKSLSDNKRALIITYTNANYDNLQRRILKEFNGVWPKTIKIMTYFSFLYSFCYKPFLADICKARGITYLTNSNRYLSQENPLYYMTKNRYLYSNRLALLIEKEGCIDNVRYRLCKYFDELIIDEVQDIAGRDFNFLEAIMRTAINMFFVGDFYQHTFDTSYDGNVNKTLFKDKGAYEQRFKEKGFTIDTETLKRSWRCSRSVCQFVTNKLKIEISSNRGEDDDSKIKYIDNKSQIDNILQCNDVIKLHYQNGPIHGMNHRNWGETKGEDCYRDVCIMLNKKTKQEYDNDSLHLLAPSTRNKLYVAITRARGNVYLVDESYSPVDATS